MKRRFGIGIFLFLLIVGIGLFIGAQRGTTAPEQPIPFNHQIHVQNLKMECMYCHSFADRSTVAGLPSVRKCMGCHKYTDPKKPGIQILLQYWNDQKPIEWTKVHDLPDFVYFSHKRHIQAGIQCQTCHGPVQEMTVAKKVSSLGMGWCLNCHNQRKAPRECWTCHK